MGVQVSLVANFQDQNEDVQATGVLKFTDHNTDNLSASLSTLPDKLIPQ